MASVNRSIRFFRLLIADKYGNLNEAKWILGELEKSINSKNTLSKYFFPDNNDVRIFAHKIEYGSSPCKLILAKTHTDLLPGKEKKQKIEPLNLSDDRDQKQGLTHKTHVCIFKDGIVGIESHKDSVTANQISQLIRHFTGHPINLRALLNSDYSSKLSKLQDITMFKIKISSELLNDLKQEKNNLLSKLGSFDSAGSEEIELVLKVNGSKSTSGLFGIPDAIKSLIKFDDNNKLSGIEVKGRNSETMKIEHYDLIDSAIISSQAMVKSDEISRDVKESSAFGAIGRAYTEMAQEIDIAVKGKVLND